MKHKFEIGSSEEYFWKLFIKYNKVKYSFIFLMGLFFGIILTCSIFLMVY